MIDWEKSALLFPGQGAQEVGMGQALAAAYPAAHQVFMEADAVLGYALSSLCFNGPKEQLDDTYYTQPAVFVTGIAALRALETVLGAAVQPAFTAGHSLGEFTALVAAGALTFPDGLRLVQRRAELMRQAGEESPGAVAALLGLEADSVHDLCAAAQDATGEVVVLANDNCPGQIVISGSVAALDKALELAQAAGAKRALKLDVSVAVHSPLMQSASAAFNEVVEATPLYTPHVPVVGNVTAQALSDVSAIRDELRQQLTGSVLWRESMQTMLDAGVSSFVELGPGEVLKGLLRRIDRSATAVSLGTPEAIQTFAAGA